MTVSTTSARVAYSGNGATTAFATPYPFFATSDLVVTQVSAAGVTTLQVETTNYVVTGGNGETGTVTMVVAPAIGVTLIIVRSVPYLQSSDYLANDSFPATVVEGDLDRLTMQVQQVLSLAQSGPVLPVTFAPGTDTQPIIPLPVHNKVLVGNSGATGWTNTAIGDLALATIPVALTSPTDGDLLRFNGSNWINTTTLSAAVNEAKGADIASATTTDIGAATGNFLDVTGTTTITGLGTVQAGTHRVVRFTGILTLTHNATSLILPGAASITTAAGDVAGFVSLGSSNWRCTTYTRAAIVPGTAAAMVGDTGSGGTAGIVPAPAAGDADKYLTGAATFVRPARVLLATKTPAAAASVTFLAADGLDATKYASYEWIVEALLPSVDGADLVVTFSTNGGSTYLSADYYWSYQTAASSQVDIFIQDDVSNAAGEGAFGTILFLPESGGRTRLQSNLGRQNAAGTSIKDTAMGGHTTTTAVNGFKLSPSSGTVTGTIRIYGNTR